MKDEIIYTYDAKPVDKSKKIWISKEGKKFNDTYCILCEVMSLLCPVCGLGSCSGGGCDYCNEAFEEYCNE